MLTVKLRAHAGSHVEEVAERMQAIADILGVDVEVDFNDVAMTAVPGGNADSLAINFYSESARETVMMMRPRMAFSDR
jgi:hypothetical protein